MGLNKKPIKTKTDWEINADASVDEKTRGTMKEMAADNGIHVVSKTRQKKLTFSSSWIQHHFYISFFLTDFKKKSKHKGRRFCVQREEEEEEEGGLGFWFNGLVSQIVLPQASRWFARDLRPSFRSVSLYSLSDSTSRSYESECLKKSRLSMFIATFC